MIRGWLFRRRLTKLFKNYPQMENSDITDAFLYATRELLKHKWWQFWRVPK